MATTAGISATGRLVPSDLPLEALVIRSLASRFCGRALIPLASGVRVG
jgi:hypothetical protein